jgi:soluble lytic murein transglycosylase
MKKFFTLFTLCLLFSLNLFVQVYDDATLATVIAKDKSNRNSTGELFNLPLTEHMFRADVYMSNRQFNNARQHWQKVIENFPTEDVIPKALFGMGRSNMWERNYETAIKWFDILVQNHLPTFHGQEGLAYKGACYVRLGQHLDAAKTYEQYTVMFPNGKRIESSYLNILDAYREAAEYDLANVWVDKTSQRFKGTNTETNALHARLRMEIFRQKWGSVLSAANELLRNNNFSKSMAYEQEVRFLKAYAYEKLGQNENALSTYSSIPATSNSYFGNLATERISALGGNVTSRKISMKRQSRRVARNYPVRFRTDVLKYSRLNNIDPRFVLAIMKQESSFRANAKSPAAARGLLQLTFDTALKFNKKAGFDKITASDLYDPTINIAIGSIYISELKAEFNGLYEAIAASYNGGEDNVARWLARSNPKEAAIFASEVGFSESKQYVFKVMGNYQVYQELYTENLENK